MADTTSIVQYEVVSDSTDDSLRELTEPVSNDSIWTIRHGSFSIEKFTGGRYASNFWQDGLTEIRYTISDKTGVLSSVEIARSDFSGIFHKDFGDHARIWDSEVLLIDTVRRKMVISNRFGIPETDNETFVLCIVDFDGSKNYLDSPYTASDTFISFNKIVNGNGVYDFSTPILEFDSCCTVFSDLINKTTLLYVIDWQGIPTAAKDNAFVIDLESKDTLDSFVFTGYSMEIGYTALIEKNENLGILAMVNYDADQLITFDTLLNKKTFDLADVEVVDHIGPTAQTSDMYSYPPGRMTIRFDAAGKPLRLVVDH